MIPREGAAENRPTAARDALVRAVGAWFQSGAPKDERHLTLLHELWARAEKERSVRVERRGA